MNFDLASHTVFLTLSGSRSYGTHTETSDFDYRGIVIAPMDFYIGIRNRFEQVVDTGEKGVWKQFPGLVQPNSDIQVMNIDKFARLALDCNPSIIEILFSDPENYLVKHPIMEKLLENKHIFLSRRARARFCGYAISQLKRIQRHKRWLDKGEISKPERHQFGLPEHTLVSRDQIGAAEALIKQEANQFTIDQNNLPEDVKINLENDLQKMIKHIWQALHTEPFPIGKNSKFVSVEEALDNLAIKDCQFSENFLMILAKEKQYRAVKQEYDAYQTWVRERNPARAELEKKFKFDTKNASQLVRLLRMAREILTTGQVNVKRPDAENLQAIRNGAWTYEQICEYAEKEETELDILVKTSILPANPDTELAHKIVSEMILEFNQYSKN